MLNLDVMFNAMAQGIGEVVGKDAETAGKAIIESYNEVKSLSLRGEIEDWEVLDESQILVAEKLDIEVDDVRRGVARGLIKLDLKQLIFPDVKTTLKQLSSRYALCIVGNVALWPGAYTRFLIEKLDLSAFFKAQLYSDEIGFSKPDKRIFAEACDLCGVDCGEAMHVGDNPKEDVAGALAAGMKAAYIKRGGGEVKVLKELGLLVIPSLESILSAVSLLEED